MQTLRGEVQWSEVAASWVRAEVESPRFGEDFRRALAESPDASPEDLLSTVRGWPDAGLFENFPCDVTWTLVGLTPKELCEVLYIDWGYWLDVTGGTRRPIDAIREMGWSEGLVPGPGIEPLVLVSKPLAERERVVVLEGHARLTRYVTAVAALPSVIHCWLGTSPNLDQWSCY